MSKTTAIIKRDCKNVLSKLGRGIMDMRGIVRQNEAMRRRCPFCLETLGKLELLKRNTRKVCRCHKCKRVLDERNLIW